MYMGGMVKFISHVEVKSKHILRTKRRKDKAILGSRSCVRLFD